MPDPESEIRSSPALREAANALWRVLKNDCRGRENARPKPRLRRDLAAAGHAVSARAMDALVTALRNDVRFPIATLEDGVFWAVRVQELSDARHWITSRYDDLRTAEKAYEKKIVRWHMRQQPQPATARAERQPTLFEAARP